MLTIRDEEAGDRDTVRRVNETAFEDPDVADLVDKLRSAGAMTLSLVAVLDGNVVAHAAWSSVDVEPDAGDLRVLGLGPVAVLPEFQRQGVGTTLVREGLRQCLNMGYAAVFVLGHPSYYPRFGFTAASGRGLRYEHDAPEEAFMVLELVDGALDGVKGTVHYDPEFA
jgi:putative acetyltransferase